MSIKSHVAGNATFTHYQGGNLWYKCADGFEFPVPIADCDSARFLAQDKGIFFMRWIRKHLETIAVGVN